MKLYPIIAVLGIAGAVAVGSASADTLNYLGGAGNWTNPASWNPAQIPNGGDLVVINANGSVVSITSADNYSGEIRLGDGTTATLVIDYAGGGTALTASNAMAIGRRNNAIATVNHLNGTVFANGVNIAPGAATSVYNLANGTLDLMLGNLNVGTAGNGTMILGAGGTVNAYRHINVGTGGAPGQMLFQGGIFNGFGTGGFTFTVGANGRLTVDGSTSTINLDERLSLANTSILEFILDGAGTSPLDVDNLVSLGGTLNVSLNGYAGIGPITLIDYAGGSLDGVENVFDNVVLNGFTANVDYNTDSQVRLTDIVIIPEPASASLFAAGAGLASLLMRRRNRKH